MSIFKVLPATIILFTILLTAGCMRFQNYKPTEIISNPNNYQQRLQLILDQAVNEFKLPGLQAGIYFPGQNLILASSGTIDFNRKRARINNDSIFKIGSTTKMFVSALIGRMVEKGLIRYNDSIDKWFPGMPSGGSITIRGLLSHTSGIKETLFTSPCILFKSVLNPQYRWNSMEVVSNIMKGMKVKPAGQRSFFYSNNNYLILGLIAEKVDGKPLHTQLEQEFFIPLHMTNTYLLPFYDKVPDGLISAYDEYIPLGPHELNPDTTSWDSLTFSAGGMASSAGDLLIWLDAFFHNRVLKSSTLAEMRSYISARNNGRDNNIFDYGLGIANYDLGGIKLEGHPGGGFGGECYPFYYPEKDVSIVVSYNWSKKDNPAGKEILKRILAQIINNN